MSTTRLPPFSKHHAFPHTDTPLTEFPDRVNLPLTPNTARAFLLAEVDVSRLNALSAHLWLAGRPGHIRPLHKQRMLRRQFVITEDPAMHLVWFENTLYLKPIPAALLSWDFWTRFICHEPVSGSAGGDDDDKDQKNRQPDLYAAALGLLLSYTKLIHHPSDHRLALAEHLLPAPLSWPAWCHLVSDLTSHPPPSPPSPRWRYGELRLSRLNWIYKVTFRGYSYFYLFTEYGPYFSRQFRLLLMAFAYSSVVLAAMQVILSYQDGESWVAEASYRFAVFAVGFVAASALVAWTLFGGLFSYHVVSTVVGQKKAMRKMHVA